MRETTLIEYENHFWGKKHKESNLVCQWDYDQKIRKGVLMISEERPINTSIDWSGMEVKLFNIPLVTTAT